MKDKTIYIIGLLAILVFMFNAGGSPLQSAVQSFTADDITGWFHGLTSTTQNIILVISGIVLFLIIISLLMR